MRKKLADITVAYSVSFTVTFLLSTLPEVVQKVNEGTKDISLGSVYIHCMPFIVVIRHVLCHDCIYVYTKHCTRYAYIQASNARSIWKFGKDLEDSAMRVAVSCYLCSEVSQLCLITHRWPFRTFCPQKSERRYAESATGAVLLSD